MCTVLLPPGVNPIAVNKYISYHIETVPQNKKKNQSARAETKIQKKSFVINVARLELNQTPHISPSI